MKSLVRRELCVVIISYYMRCTHARARTHSISPCLCLSLICNLYGSPPLGLSASPPLRPSASPPLRFSDSSPLPPPSPLLSLFHTFSLCWPLVCCRSELYGWHARRRTPTWRQPSWRYLLNCGRRLTSQKVARRRCPNT